MGLPATGANSSDGPKTWGDYQYEIVADTQVVYLVHYTGQDTVVTVPATIEGLPVVKLGAVFRGNTTIQEVTIPDGGKLLNNTFKDCTSLKKVHLPKGLLAIGSNTFYSCSSLEQLIIPESVQVIDHSAIGDCPNLTVQGKAGSVVETACTEKRIPFEPLPSPAYSLGDVNKDGAITATDARLTLQAAVGKITFGEKEQQTAADVDGNGEVNVSDARLILGYSVGKDTFTSDLPSSNQYRLIPALPSNWEIIGQGREDMDSATITRPAGPIADPATFAKIVNHITSQPPIGYFSPPKLLPSYQFTWTMQGEVYGINIYRNKQIAVHRMNTPFLFEWTEEQIDTLIACMDG